MKKNLTASVLFAFIVSLPYEGCDNSQSPSFVADTEKDTLFTTIVQTEKTLHTTSLYRYISQKDVTGFDTVYSELTPPSSKLILFGSAEDCHAMIKAWRIILLSSACDTQYRFVDNPATTDTVFITGMLTNYLVTYDDTIDCRIDTIESYRRNTRPGIVDKESLAGVLSTATEGYRQYIPLDILHFKYDETEITLLNNPPWIMLYRVSSNEIYGDCWFYPLCKDGDSVWPICPFLILKNTEPLTYYSSCFKPHILLNPDSTAVDSVYNWQIVVTNNYDQSDTMDISTRVVPFPDSWRCR